MFPCQPPSYSPWSHSYLNHQRWTFPGIFQIQGRKVPSSSSSIWALASLEYMALRRVFLSRVVWSASMSYRKQAAVIQSPHSPKRHLSCHWVSHMYKGLVLFQANRHTACYRDRQFLLQRQLCGQYFHNQRYKKQLCRECFRHQRRKGILEIEAG